MWYEILPSMAIMTGCLSFPPVAAYFIHKFFQNGNVKGGSTSELVGTLATYPCRRSISSQQQRRQYLRDIRITGNTYVIAGLEAIPDEK